MTAEYSRNTLLPDVCRCCLSVRGTWDLTSSCDSNFDIKEINDMLQDCYGIQLSLWKESSQVICGSCVEQLRGANKFRMQVMQAEITYTKYSKLRLDNQHNIKNGSRYSGVVNKRSNKDIINEEYDSDTPISKLININITSKIDEVVNNDKLQYVQCKSKLYGKGELIKQQKFKVKFISERKRVMLTCGTVLKETTACPFRHRKSWFQCFFCQQEFIELNILRQHTGQHHSDVDKELKNLKRYPRSLQIDISNLECRHCNLNLPDVGSMRRHFDDVHDKVIYNECIADYKVNASPYSCHLCKQQFHVFRTLTTHLNEHYTNCICDVCGKSFLNSKRLKVHKRTHEDGQYPCNECGKILKTKTSKANHKESAHSKRILKCQICLEPMKHYNARIKHMSKVHNITHKFKCEICGREYNIKHYLATHMRQTHGHKNKKCLDCGMAFITNHSLKKHMLKHTGERPHKCTICFKSYVRSYTLKEHMRTHEN